MLLVLTLTAGGCAVFSGPTDPAEMDPGSIILARVGESQLSLEDAMSTFLSSHSGHGALVTGEKAVRELAGRTVERELFLAEARSLGVPDDPDIVEAVHEHRLGLAVSAFWKREVTDKVHVADEEVEAFYAKTDLALRLTLIEVADQAQAEELRARVEAGEDMADLARAVSIHASRSFGGELPFVRRGELEPALEGPAFALTTPGELTPVIKTANGYAFLRLVERLENANRPDREVALPQIRRVLVERAIKDRRAEVNAELLTQVETSRDEVLAQPEQIRELLVGEGDDERVLVRCGDESLTLGALRSMLNLEKVAAATPSDLAKVIPSIADDWVSKRAVRQVVETSSLMDEPTLVASTAKFRDELVMSVLHDRYVFADIEITDEDVRAFYDEHLADEFTRPAEVRLAHILVATEEEAQGILDRVRSGEDFASIAKEVSLDKATAFHSGRVGWVRPGQILPEIDDRAFALKVGEYDGPIHSEFGYHVIAALDRRESMVVPFAMAKDAARRKLLKVRRREAHDAWTERLSQRADIELLDEGIEQAVAWLDAEAARKAAEESPTGPPGPAPDGPPPLLQAPEGNEGAESSPPENPASPENRTPASDADPAGQEADS